LLVSAHPDRTGTVTGQSTSDAIDESVLGARTLYLGLCEYHHSFVLLNLCVQLSGFFHAGLHAS
jgi:hypothetical protein